MHALPLLLDEALRRIAAGPLCVGFSGGLDSTALLHALASLPAARARGLRAWHVHHGLHVDADRWAAHCEATCAALAVPLAVSRVDVARDAGLGPEAAARQARHAAFREGLADGEILVFAHHRDDQAETFLLRAMRASGPDGLAAMRAWRGFGNGRLWRPLLGEPRASLQAYAAGRQLRWIEDPGNTDESFDRNFLRRRVLPLMRERWPHADASLARSAALCGEAAGLLDAEDERALADVTIVGSAGSRCSMEAVGVPAVPAVPRKAGKAEESGEADDGCGKRDPTLLSRSLLSTLAPPRRARALRRWIHTLGLPPLPATGIAQIESTLLSAREDASATFEWHGAVVHAWRDLLHAGWVRPPLPSDWRVEWDGVEPLALPGGGTLSLHAFVGAASAANRNRFAEAVADSPSSPLRGRRGCEGSGVGGDVQVAAEAAPPREAAAQEPGVRGDAVQAQESGVRGDARAAEGPHATGGFGRCLVVHARLGGERITLPGRDHSHALKQVLQDLSVPPWERARLPLLSTADGELLAAGDRVCSASFERWLCTHDARLHWCPASAGLPVD